MAYQWGWTGAATPDGFTVKIRAGAGQAVRLKVSQSPAMTSPTWFGPVTAEARGFAELVATGLPAATQHYWQAEVDGVLVTAANGSGGCKTFPTEGAPFGTFTIGHWTCAGQNSNITNSAANANAFDAIRAKNPDLITAPGDIHYWNPTLNDIDDHLHGYVDMMNESKNPKLARLCRDHPMVHVWSDHDYAGNLNPGSTYGGYGGNGNSDREDPGRPAACTAYRLAVPHYPLVRADGLEPDGAIYHKTKIGRIHMIMSDLRSCRTPDPTPHGPTKTMMGAEQKAWFFQALLDAKADESPIILWVQETTLHLPRNSDASLGYNQDNWAAFHNERMEIARFLRDNQIPPIVSLQGDLHYSAGRARINLFDLTDTAHGDPPAGLPHAPIMSIHASRLESNSAFALSGAGVWDVTGLDLTTSKWNDEGMYAFVTITDDGNEVTVTHDIWKCDKVTAVDAKVGTQSRTFRPNQVPPTPTGLAVLKKTAATNFVRWDPVADTGVLSYRIYKDGVLVGEVGASSTSATV